MSNFDWTQHQSNKIEQFYSDNGVVTIGYIEKKPFISHNPLLPNPTDNRRYDYSTDKTIMYIFDKPMEIEKFIDKIDSILFSQSDDSNGIFFKYNRDWDFQNRRFNRSIWVGKQNGISSLFFEEAVYNITIQHPFRNGLIELKLIKRFFEQYLNNIIFPFNSNEINIQETQSYFTTNINQGNQYLRNNKATVVKQKNIIEGVEADLDNIINGKE